MRAFRAGLLIAAVLVGATFAAADRADPRPSVSIAGYWTPAGDSIRIVGRWTRVADARGRVDSVRYDWKLWTGMGTAAAVVHTGPAVTTDSISRMFPRPLPGDTVHYSITLRAIDARGAAGQEVRSPYLLVTTPWTPPVTPPVGVDTLQVADLPYDSLTIFRMDSYTRAPKYLGGAGEPMQLGVLDSLKLCTFAWKQDRPHIPGFEITYSNPEAGPEHPGGVLSFRDLGGGCAMMVALTHTTVPDLPGAQAYYRTMRLAAP